MFVAGPRPLFSVRTMCRYLRIHPSGFYARLRNPFSKRAKKRRPPDRAHPQVLEGQRQGVWLSQAARRSARSGATCCANRVARLAIRADIKAQIGYKRRPGSYSGKPSLVVDNTLDQQFDVDAPDRIRVTDNSCIWTLDGSSIWPLWLISTSTAWLVGQCTIARRRRWSCRHC